MKRSITSPSNLFRRLLCPGSEQAELGLSEDEESAAAAAGTRLHDLDATNEEPENVSEEEILADLQRCSLPPEALTRNCCWSEICRLRGLNPHIVDEQSWREICATRGYLLARQNPRGF